MTSEREQIIAMRGEGEGLSADVLAELKMFRAANASLEAQLADKTAECVSICADKLAGLIELRAQLTEARAHRDRLVEALQHIHEAAETSKGYPTMQSVAVADRARSALDSIKEVTQLK